MSATVTGFNADKTTHTQTTPATVSAKTMSQTVLGCAAEGSNTITVSATGDTFTGSVDGIDSVYYCSNLGHTDASKKTLDNVPAGLTVNVYGAASPEGTTRHNLKLSENRAKAVAEYLKGRGVKVNEVAGGDKGRAAMVIPVEN